MTATLTERAARVLEPAREPRLFTNRGQSPRDIAGVQPSALRGIEVKTFVRPPGGDKKPTDLGQLNVDPSKLSCDQGSWPIE